MALVDSMYCYRVAPLVFVSLQPQRVCFKFKFSAIASLLDISKDIQYLDDCTRRVFRLPLSSTGSQSLQHLSVHVIMFSYYYFHHPTVLVYSVGAVELKF